MLIIVSKTQCLR